MDDRTDDCAFGAMMLLALRPKFRKLRFQMIDDTQQHPHMNFLLLTKDYTTGVWKVDQVAPKSWITAHSEVIPLDVEPAAP